MRCLRSSQKPKVEGSPATICMDTGAFCPVLDMKSAMDRSLRIKPSRDDVVIGIGKNRAKLYGSVTIPVAIGQYHSRVKCLVSDLPDGIDLILGDSWLLNHHAVLAYKTQTCELRKGSRQFTLHGINSIRSINDCALQTDLDSQPFVLTALQCKRGLRKGSLHPIAIGVLKPALDDAQLNKQPECVRELLQKYSDVFQPVPTGLPPDRGIEHLIPLVPGATPQFKSMYRLSPSELEEAKRQVADYLARGWIEPSTSPWGAPILFVKKKTGSLRMCIDYRALNKLTVKNRYPLPRIDDLLDKLAGAKYFSAIDLTTAYHQVRINDEDVPKTAFRTPMGHFQFRVITFGFTNAPSTFQRVMNHVFAPYLDHFVLVYLDDIMVFSKTLEEHLHHLELVLQALQKHKLYANLGKSHFCRLETAYLGHIISHEGTKPDPSKTAAVTQWPVPKDTHQLKQFLGLAQYFAKYIRAYGPMAAPLYALLKKNVPWQWGDNQAKAFALIKEAMTSPPLLQLPDWTKSFTLVCDASVHGVGSVLLQDDKPIAFRSRKFTPAEYNYSTGDQELLAVIDALQFFRCYVEGISFVLVTDHKPNTYLQTKSMLSRKEARYLDFLQRFTFEWKHISGRQNVADPLSRVPTICIVMTRSQTKAASTQFADATVSPTVETVPEVINVDPPTPMIEPVPTLSANILDRVRAATTADPWFQDPRNTVKYRLRNGVFYFDNRVTVPQQHDLIKSILALAHDAPGAGHFGVSKTLKSIKRSYWWPSMLKDVKHYVKHCPTCQHNKSYGVQPGQLQYVELPDNKWDVITMDFITGLPTTRRKHNMVFVVVDKLTKLTHIIPTVDTLDAPQFADLFFKEVWRLHGLPTKIISDRDKLFISDFWRRLCSLLHIHPALSSSYHPQTDGQTERVNRVIEEVLRAYVSRDLSDWDLHLPAVEFAINDSCHEVTKSTPFYLTYGIHPRTPLTYHLQTGGGKRTSKKDEGSEFAAHMMERVKHV
jgi:hypothetical protein